MTWLAGQEFEGYILIGLEQDFSFLDYKKTSMVHGNLEYGSLYDNETDEEYSVKVDHTAKTITVIE